MRKDEERGEVSLLDVKKTASKMTRDDLSEYGVKSVAGKSIAGKSIGGKSIAGKSIAGRSITAKSVAGKSIVSIGGKSILTTNTNIPVIIRGVSQPSIAKVSLLSHARPIVF